MKYTYLCELSPPQFVGDGGREIPGENLGDWGWPRVGPDDGCSHHPDFPAWLAEWKAERNPKPPEDWNSLERMALGAGVSPDTIRKWRADRQPDGQMVGKPPETPPESP